MHLTASKKRLRVGLLIATLTLFNTMSAFANWTHGDDDLAGHARAVKVMDENPGPLASISNISLAFVLLTDHLRQQQQIVLYPGPQQTVVLYPGPQYTMIGQEEYVDPMLPARGDQAKKTMRMQQLD